MAALHWWRDRCVELRLKRQQTGKVSEQGYLSQMMNEFEGIHTLQHSGGGVAPWNVQQYEFFMEGNQILGTEYALRRDFELIFYHFHFLQIFSNGTVDLGRQNLSHQTMRLIYRPYINELENIENEMRVKYPDLNLQGIEPCKTTLKTIISSAYRKSRGVYNVFKIQEFLQGIIK
jgi:hypothetical protein